MGVEESIRENEGKGEDMENINKLKPIFIEREKFYFSFSYDIDDFIGQGFVWLQIYDHKRNMLHDKPFAWGIEPQHRKRVRKVIASDFVSPRSLSL